MTTTADFDRYYATMSDRNDRIARSRHQTFGGDAAIASLRCFKRYHKDARTDIYDVSGRLRWLTRKQAAIYGLLMRQATSRERITMSEIARETACCTSTVSRAITKFQAWRIFAIDVTRGRAGGITVRLRTMGDNLQSYAEAAWQRIKAAAYKVAIRARINVASTTRGLDEVGNQDPLTPTDYLLTMDATFSRDVYVEQLGAAIRAGTVDVTAAAARSGRVTEADREWASAEEWAREVILERQRLDRDEPDWDLELDKVRASYGMDDAS